MALSLQAGDLYGALFGDPELARLLDDEAEIASLIEAEAALARAEAEVGLIPAETGRALAAALEGCSISPQVLAEATAAAGVPVPGLLAALRERLPADQAHWLHWGATSQDIVDTALVLRLRRALALLGGRLGALIDRLAEQSLAHAEVVIAGRTRSQVATPVTLGLRIALWAQPLIEAEAALPALRQRLFKVQLGGAAGANTALGAEAPAVIAAYARELDLAPAPPWHTARGPLVALAGWVMELAAGLGKMSADLLVAARSEIGELRAGKGGGSSTMPQKANPVQAEALAVLCRMALAAAENLPRSATHGEERDGVSWTLEWEFLPRALMAAGAALRHATALAESLEPDRARIATTLSANPAMMAEAAAFALARIMPRPEAQAAVKEALASGRPLAEALAAIAPQIDWAAILDPQSAAGPSRAMAMMILERRGRMVAG